jgi:predicted DNA-binding transcriptional regulator AlpA
MIEQDDPLLTTKEAAKHLKCSESYLAKERGKGTGPEFITLGRAIRYRRSSLEAYTAAQTRTSTSQYRKPDPRQEKRAPARRRKKELGKTSDLPDTLSNSVHQDTSEYMKYKTDYDCTSEYR